MAVQTLSEHPFASRLLKLEATLLSTSAGPIVYNIPGFGAVQYHNTKVCIQNRCLLSSAVSLRTQQQRNLAGGAAYSAWYAILCVHQCDRCGRFGRYR